MSRCKACGAEIKWIRTVAGKMMPCDPNLVYFRPSEIGELQVVTVDGTIQRGTKADRIDIAMCGYVSHFATCPAADYFRRR